MLVLKELYWSYGFSYGPNNRIDFSQYPLLQLIGKNGHGKTSIRLILEEVLFNKNSKGVKKTDILNRYSDSKSYSIGLLLERDGVDYEIITKRGSTQTVVLKADGVDISSHTATATYKQIEDIIGMDHKTFCQIISLESSASLEFLTATDSTRKKFLIDLLSLSKYTSVGEVFKGAAKQVELQVNSIQAKIESLNTWIARNSNIDLTFGIIKEVPEPPTALEKSVIDFRTAIANITTTNKRITQNNQYKKLRDALVVEPVGPKPNTDSNELISEKATLLANKAESEKLLKSLKKPISECHTCKRPFPKDETFEKTFHDLNHTHTKVIEDCDFHVNRINTKLYELKAEESEWQRKAKIVEQYEQYHSLYDPAIESELQDYDVLQKQLDQVSTQISEINKEIKRITDENNLINSKNAKIEVISQQLKEFSLELVERSDELRGMSGKLNNLNILVKTFSPSGLVAYKIECMVKDLENLTNEYLSDISSGRFQLSFQISGTDKLNVIITDNGRDIDIAALSSGERSRVNVATLLGIRKLLQALSNNKTNLLFLDETMENLDAEGKERLVEILLNEEGLNTVIVSHSFTHPLIERVSIIKENNISRIE